MGAIIIEHVKVGDLPEDWRKRLDTPASAHVTVRIEEEAIPQDVETTGLSSGGAIEDPAFGLWRDRSDLADVEAYLRKIRAPRYGRDGTRGGS